MNTNRLSIVMMALLLCAGLVTAQEVNLEKHPGYIDLESIRIPSEAITLTDIDLGPALLRLAGMMSEDENDELQKSLASLLSIRVKSFEIDEANIEGVLRAMDRIEKRLADEAWERLVFIRNGEERTNISLRLEDDKIVGFVLMSVDDEEVTFINVVGGNIDMDTIKEMGSNFDFEDRLVKSIEKDGQDLWNW